MCTATIRTRGLKRAAAPEQRDRLPLVQQDRIGRKNLDAVPAGMGDHDIAPVFGKSGLDAPFRLDDRVPDAVDCGNDLRLEHDG